MIEKKYLSVSQIRKIAGLHKKVVLKIVKDDNFPYFWIGNDVFIFAE